jgi:hypothetical protein
MLEHLKGGLSVAVNVEWICYERVWPRVGENRAVEEDWELPL